MFKIHTSASIETSREELRQSIGICWELQIKRNPARTENFRSKRMTVCIEYDSLTSTATQKHTIERYRLAQLAGSAF